jgi:hypothetical protein
MPEKSGVRGQEKLEGFANFGFSERTYTREPDTKRVE